MTSNPVFPYVPYPDQLRETIAGMTQKPRATLNELEQRIATLRELIATRENLLVAAISEHDGIAHMAAVAIANMHEEMDSISDTFRRAMRPTPIAEDHEAPTEAMRIAAE